MLHLRGAASVAAETRKAETTGASTGCEQGSRKSESFEESRGGRSQPTERCDSRGALLGDGGLRSRKRRTASEKSESLENRQPAGGRAVSGMARHGRSRLSNDNCDLGI